MTRNLALLALAFLLPLCTLASTVETSRSLVVSGAIPDNAYLSGTDVNVTVALPADVMAAGGTLTLQAPVAGDAMLVGGTVDVKGPVAGDARILGGRVVVEDRIGGDLVVAGQSVLVMGSASSTRIAGGSVRLTGGSDGPVHIYGADVYLSGTFDGDVNVVASDSVTLGEGTVIRGALKYNAPQEATLPLSATVDGGVAYTGSFAYLPTNEEARTFALAGASVLFVVRIVAALIAVGLLAGLFPALSRSLIDTALVRSPRRFVLHALLGFAILIATPVFMLLLALSFVGLGVAFMLALLYLLLLMLGYLGAGILAGALLSRLILKKPYVSWRGAVLGMLALHIIGLVPAVGFLATLALALVAMGALLLIFYRFAFTRERDEDDA
ncbi:MAG TPA: hypothetical protein VHO23_01375 [Candidatus Paceibacterota bacterium]|nr:hypothetical protein [Candidatus Paceibacterota bacterium]